MMDGLSYIVGELFTGGELALWQRFQFHPGDFRSCLKIIFCHLKVKGALLGIFFSEAGVTIIIIHE